MFTIKPRTRIQEGASWEDIQDGDCYPETQEEVEKKCFYFLAGPFYQNQMENLIDRMTAQEFDNYLEYPRYARFHFVPAHIESI